MNAPKELIIIAGITKNNALGKNNDLLVKSKTDLKRFKELTSNNIVIMGFNTCLSLPKFPLPNRVNIVIGPHPHKLEQEYLGFKYSLYNGYISADKDVYYVTSLEDAFEICNHDIYKNKKAYIMGGAYLYKTSIDYATKLCLTEFNIEVNDADVYFPNISDKTWVEVERIHSENSDTDMDFVTYVKNDMYKQAKKYTKKPVEIEAVQYIPGKELAAVTFLTDGNIADELLEKQWDTTNAIFTPDKENNSVNIQIKTLEGLMNVSPGDFIIKGVNGEFYPCKPDIFFKTYQL